jgi:hypothetical protein
MSGSSSSTNATATTATTTTSSSSIIGGNDKLSSIQDELSLEALEQHPLRFQNGCEAVRLHRGIRSWASMTSHNGIIGMFGTYRGGGLRKSTYIDYVVMWM